MNTLIGRAAVVLLLFTANAGASPYSEITTLKQRRPNWKTEIVATHENGNPSAIILYERGADGFDYPMKALSYSSDHLLLNESDLTLIEPDDPRALSTRSRVQFHGPSIDYYPQGTIEKITFYYKGLKEGVQKEYYPTGILRKFTTYIKDQKEGSSEEHYENGSVKKREQFLAGRLVGSREEFYEKERPSATFSYRNGVLDGEAREWYNDGALKSIRLYANGLLNNNNGKAAVSSYYADQTMREELNFRNGTPDGQQKRYYPNGQLGSLAFYRLGKKEGVETFYFEEGSKKGESKYTSGIPVGEHWSQYLSGQRERIAQYDAGGSLLGPIVEYNEAGNKRAEYLLSKDGKLDGSYREWYPGGELHCDHRYQQGLFEGEQREYHSNGTSKLQAFYANGKIDGLYERWHENGQLAERGQFKAGKKDGESHKWFENGETEEDGLYRNGVLEGPHKRWHSNGQIAEHSAYEGGVKQGWQRRWSDKGALVFEAFFENDLPTGFVREWYEANSPKGIYSYRNGRLDGKSEEYHANGKLANSAYYKSDLLDGQFRSWYEDGSPEREFTYSEGLPVGVHKEFHPRTEGQEVQKEAKVARYNERGRLHGAQNSFYDDGSKQAQLTYDDGIPHGKKNLWSKQGILIEESSYVHGNLEGPYYLRKSNGGEITSSYKENKLHGLYRIYHPPHNVFGKVKALESNYIDGRIEGELAEYNEAGTKIRSTHYVAGIKEGPATVYDHEGRIIIAADFHNDNQNGLTREFFPGGGIKKEVVFVDDKREGKETTYYDSGQIAAVRYYKEDLLSGPSQKWNSNGILTFEADYLDGKKHGRFNKYNNDGSPRVLQRYEGDTLVEKWRAEDYDQQMLELQQAP